MQINSAVPQSSPTSVALPFTAAQTAGNLNVIVVGWNNNTTTVTSVTDSKGNIYQLAVGPTTTTGLSQSIYYARNIASATAGSNTVTVQFSAATAFPDIRIVEYSGADQVNPVDVVAAAVGTGTTSNSGAATTTTAADLIFGASTVTTHNTGPGSGFTQRIITSPDGDIVEDKNVTVVGSYNASAPMTNGRWVMQMVAFRTPVVSGGDTTPPTAPTNLAATAASGTQINLTWTASTDAVGVTNYLIERCQGSGCSAFAQVGTSTTTSFSDTGLTNGTSYSYRVRATDAAGNLSSYSTVATTATPDTQAPTAPTNLAGSAASTTQISLTWTASTDNVGVNQYLIESCQGASCTAFAQIGTSTATTFSNTGLTANTTYRFRVRANDAAGNLSSYSAIASASTPAAQDTQAPTAPSSLAASAVSSSQINLTWSDATDNTAVTNYLVERCLTSSCTFAQVGTSTSLAFGDNGLTASTGYSYRVRATDAAGNLGPYSNTASATTSSVVATGSPVFVSEAHSAIEGIDPSNNQTTLTLNVTGTNRLLIAAWHAEFDGGVPNLWTTTNNGVQGTLLVNTDGYTGGSGNQRFRIYYWLNPPLGTNTIKVFSPYTGDNELAVAVLLFNNVAQTNPFGTPVIDASASSRTSESETVNSAVGDLVLHVIGEALVTTGTLGTGETQLLVANDGKHAPQGDASILVSSKPGTSPTTTVSSSGWASRVMTGVGVAIHGAAPAGPTSLTATTVSTSQINLGWVAPSGFTVASYLIERCQGSACTNFAQIGTATAGSLGFSDSGLNPSTTYSYQVRATDASGNLTAYSNVATATTAAAADTQAPTAPSNLNATAISGTQINLTWTAATDNIGVTQYLIERCQGTGCTSFAQIGTSTATTLNNTGLTAGTTYSFRVRASDAAPNLGPYSNTATATTTAPDTQAPTAPSNLATSVLSSAQINLSWTAATDNVAVTNYLVERCLTSSCTFAQIGTATTTAYSDNGLAANTGYSYRVRATDAAGNLGSYSNTATATTQATVAGLVAAYGFEEGTGTTVADLSGQGNVGTLVNATWTTSGKFGKALSFNGTNARVNIPDAASLRLTSAMTLEAWVNPSTVTSAWRDVIYKGGNDNYLLEGTTNRNNGAPGGGATVGSTNLILNSASRLTVNTWTHLAVTYDGSTLTFYVNGTAAASQAITGLILTSTGALQIGGDSFYGQYFAGLIDEVRVYNVALTAAQLQADMASQVAFPDTQAPSAPTSLTATSPSGSQINLSWVGATDNVGVTQYLVESCTGASCSTFTQVGVATGTAFSHTGLTSNTSYSYRVRASDAAGNLGAYSNVATTTTQAPDTQNPSQPTNLAATAASGSQINLSWTASTDNIGVTGYLIERCTGTNCTSFARQTTVPGTSYVDSGLVSNTSYTYQVKATDAAGNFSIYSTTATTTTLNTLSGLVAAYTFDEGAGTSVTDVSGNGNTGTLSNTTWVTTGKFGKALSFNGTSSLVTIPNNASLQLTTGMTLEAWVNPAVTVNGWRDIIYKGNDNYFLEAYSNHTSFPSAGLIVGSAHPTIFGTAVVPANTWTHLASTYDGNTLILYVNGVAVSSSLQAGSIVTSANPLQIGGDSIFGQFFNGLIDEIRVYNVPLNITQIQADMATPTGTGGSLPLAVLDKTSLAFGNQQTGSTSAAQVVTLSNPGGAALTINSITLTGGNPGDFARTTTCGSTLAASGTCTISVTFTPTTTGSRIATLSISDNAVGTPHSVSLSGTGTGFQVTPRNAVVTFTQTQQFLASNSNVTWSVDGVAGGSTTVGTITASGLYTPPAAVGTHTITATVNGQSQSASSTAYVSNVAGMYTHHNDNLRSGLNSTETVLTQSNVNQASFGKLFSYTLDGVAYASPLYVANVAIPGQGFHNVVYVATEHNSVYALDADNLSSLPLWQTNFLSAGVTTVPCADTGECGDIATEIGITGTPVIDPATKTLYVVAKTKEGSNYFQRLHALDITTGAEKFGGPVTISGSVTGNGSGAVGGQVPFSPLRENQRPALALSNGVVYIGWSSHGDHTPWHGWIMGYNATTLAQTMIYCVTPDGSGGGVWQSGGAPGVDASGNVYFISANGDFSADTGGRNYSTAVIKLNPSGAVVDYFAPFDQATLGAGNYDLSSAGPTLLIDQPGTVPHLLITAAKNGTIYVLNRDNMGHFQSGSDSQIVQSIPNAVRHGGNEEGNYSVPVFFNNRIYFGAVSDTLKTFQLSNGKLTTAPTSQSAVTYPNRGASFAVSSNGTSNGILWAVQDNNPSNGVLRAYDANNLATELYNTSQAGTRDTFGLSTKFSIPLVVNGKVFIIAQQQLVAYGLLP